MVTSMQKEIINLLDVMLRCIVSLITLFLVTKMIGKKQVSQFSLFDYVIGISIGNFAAEMAINLESSYLHGTIAVIVFGLVAYLVSYITMRNLKIRKIIIGEPTFLIKKGKIIYKNLKKEKFDIKDLLEEARINGHFDISEIDYALMETNGKISFLEKNKSEKKGLCLNLIIDGKIIEETLEEINKDKKWLKDRINENKIDDILLATINERKEIKIYKKNVNDE